MRTRKADQFADINDAYLNSPAFVFPSLFKKVVTAVDWKLEPPSVSLRSHTRRVSRTWGA